MLASQEGKIDAVELLLKHNANVNAKNKVRRAYSTTILV